MKLLEYKEHEATNDMQRIGCLISVIVSLIAWALIIFSVVSLYKYITQPFSSQEKVKHLAVVEDTPRLTINTTIQTEQPKYYDIPLSHELQDYVRENCKTIKPELVFAVMEKESQFDINAIGEANEVGLMQIHPCNFGWLASDWNLNDLHDPKQNIKAGIILLEYLTGRESDIHMGLMYYNMTTKAAERQFSKGIYKSEYSQEIVKRAEEMRGM